MGVFRGKRVMLGVTGGVSAFKAVELLRLLTKAGAIVDVVMTKHATDFIGVTTMKGLSGRPVLLDLFDLPADFTGDAAIMPHLEVAENADLALVVPATANTMAKMAMGLADNALVTALLSVTCPVIVAPGMDADMWRHPATQANAALLRARGVHIIGPHTGELARGNVGPGRLAEPEEIADYAARLLAQSVDVRGTDTHGVTATPLAGRHVLVSAGGTREPIDPVRFIANRSSGKMGFAIAEAARAAGARVTLVHGPSALAVPEGCTAVPVETALEMHAAVMARLDDVDAVIMAAAVADYRVENVADEKMKKEGRSTVSLTLVPNPDIAAEVGARRRPDQALVIFAAETENLLENARRKLAAKKASFVVANDVSKAGSGFDVDTNEVTLLFADGDDIALPLMGKDEVAVCIVRHLATSLQSS